MLQHVPAFQDSASGWAFPGLVGPGVRPASERGAHHAESKSKCSLDSPPFAASTSFCFRGCSVVFKADESDECQWAVSESHPSPLVQQFKHTHVAACNEAPREGDRDLASSPYNASQSVAMLRML